MTASLFVRPSATSADFALLAELFREYVATLGFPLTFQDIDRELEQIAVEYGPPSGRAWTALIDQDPAGCAGIRRFDEHTAELKRMYVRPAYRGRGVGAALAVECVEAAQALGYERLVLDTVAGMQTAIAIYRSLGFVEIPAYRYNPRPDALYFALDLAQLRP